MEKKVFWLDIFPSTTILQDHILEGNTVTLLAKVFIPLKSHTGPSLAINSCLRCNGVMR
uniref:Uncharacterized protein n=1 Tax=Anguilla anguilla TaxID=7936 RepID=A0A0E9W2E9_ANGAN